MNNRHIIFFDLDGTLVDSNNQVNSNSEHMIRQLQANGHLCFVATGRGYCSVPDSLKKVMDGFITVAGGTARYQDRILFDLDKKVDLLNKVAEYGYQNNVPTFTESDGCLGFIGIDDQPLSDWFIEGKRWCDRHYNNYRQYISDETNHMAKLDVYDQTLPILKKKIDGFKDELYYMDSAGGWIEILSRQISKGKAVAHVANALNVDLKNTICIGDSENDESMFEVCGTGIAVANAQEGLKQMASVVLQKETQEGLLEVFQQMGLIK